MLFHDLFALLFVHFFFRLMAKRCKKTYYLSQLFAQNGKREVIVLIIFVFAIVFDNAVADHFDALDRNVAEEATTRGRFVGLVQAELI